MAGRAGAAAAGGARAAAGAATPMPRFDAAWAAPADVTFVTVLPPEAPDNAAPASNVMTPEEEAAFASLPQKRRSSSAAADDDADAGDDNVMTAAEEAAFFGADARPQKRRSSTGNSDDADNVMSHAEEAAFFGGDASDAHAQPQRRRSRTIVDFDEAVRTRAVDAGAEWHREAIARAEAARADGDAAATPKAADRPSPRPRPAPQLSSIPELVALAAAESPRDPPRPVASRFFSFFVASCLSDATTSKPAAKNAQDHPGTENALPASDADAPRPRALTPL
ncbi:hypothetical protein M885DRAFT_518859 [Pelagophyceae sp. CCMP2097]|nr:hypothetical protein M885DRAFT_518859 [Pelagophyceae sp. CCMP2097]